MQILFLKIAVTNMWFSKPKKSKAADKWHNKAMLVDPKKTRITFLWAETPEICENEDNSDSEELAIEPSSLNAIETSNKQVFKENLEAGDLNTQKQEQKLRINDTNVEAVESDIAETSDSELNEKNLEIKGMTTETKTQNTEDTSSEEDTAENSEALVPKLQDVTTKLTEADRDCEYEEDLGTWEEDLDSIKLRVTEESVTMSPIENLVEPNGTEDTYIPEVTDSTHDCSPVKEEPLNVKFLRVLEKTRSKWSYDKKFAKIVQKMEKGKKLKRKEFDKVYMHIHNYCQNSQRFY